MKTFVSVVCRALIGAIVAGGLTFAVCCVLRHDEMFMPDCEAKGWAWLGAELMSAAVSMGGFVLGAIYGIYGVARARKAPLRKVTGWGVTRALIGVVANSAILICRPAQGTGPYATWTIVDAIMISLWIGAPIGFVLGAICGISSTVRQLPERNTGPLPK